MDAFEVQLAKNIYVIEPKDNGLFTVFQGERKLGMVYTLTKMGSSSGLRWTIWKLVL